MRLQNKMIPIVFPSVSLSGPHLFIQVSVHLFNKYLVSTYDVAGTGNTPLNKSKSLPS